MCCKDEHVVLDVLAHLPDGRVGKEGGEFIQHFLKRQGSRRFRSGSYGNVPCFARSYGYGEADELRPERIGSRRFRIKYEGGGFLKILQQFVEIVAVFHESVGVLVGRDVCGGAA